MIEYVKMSSEDLGGMVEVEKQCFNSGFALKTFEKELENRNSVYIVARKNKMVVGYAGAWNICGCISNNHFIFSGNDIHRISVFHFTLT